MAAQAVCHMHGGKASRALANAEERMKQLVHPSIASLARQIDADEFNAVRYVLDWAGFRAVEKVSTDSEIVITVRREEAPPLILERTVNRALTNGNGHA